MHRLSARLSSLAQRAVAAHRLGHFEQAEKLYRLFLAREPDNPTALHLLGTLLHRKGEAENGRSLLEKAALLQPFDAEIHNNLGVALNTLGRFAEAAESLERSVGLDPRSASTRCNLGVAYRGLRRFADATESLKQSLALATSAGAYSNLGLVHLDLGDAQEAHGCFHKATLLDPEWAQGHVHLGHALSALDRLPEALASYEAALTLDPAHGNAIAQRSHLRQVLCDWRNIAADREALTGEAETWRASDPPAPFAVLALTDDPKAQLLRARAHARRFAAPTTGVSPRASGGVIKLAYLSPDFRQHPVAALMVDILVLHDRTRFDVTALSLGPDDCGRLRSRIEDAADRFIDVRERSDADIAAAIREEGVDILIDLAGFTTHSRPAILASRPARIQINYLGYPGTTGADWIDYTIADGFIARAPDLQEHFSEAIARLPGCFQASSHRPAPRPATPTRTARSLPEDGFVFCAFSNTYKLTPELFDVWMRLLAALPGSVLWLLGEREASRSNLRREAERCGVHPDRLVFSPRVPYEEYLAHLPLADLFLDTFPYNAGATASDALRMGVPLLTLSGRSYASRMAGSLLTHLNLPDLVTTSLADYERMALRLALDPELLAGHRRHLNDTLGENPAIFDPRAFVLRLEAAFLGMIDRADNGLKSVGFDVAP